MGLGMVMEGVDSVCKGKQPVIKSAQYSVKAIKWKSPFPQGQFLVEKANSNNCSCQVRH